MISLRWCGAFLAVVRLGRARVAVRVTSVTKGHKHMNALPTAIAAAIVLSCASSLTTHAQAQVSAYASMRAPHNLAPSTSPVPFGSLDVFPSEDWNSHTDMPSARWAHALASYSVGAYPLNDAFVYAISGGDGSFANTSSVLRYDVIVVGGFSQVVAGERSAVQIGTIDRGV